MPAITTTTQTIVNLKGYTKTISTRTTKNSTNIPTQASQTMHRSMRTTHRFKSIMRICNKFGVATAFCLYLHQIANVKEYQAHARQTRTKHVATCEPPHNSAEVQGMASVIVVADIVHWKIVQGSEPDRCHSGAP